MKIISPITIENLLIEMEAKNKQIKELKERNKELQIEITNLYRSMHNV